MPDAAINIYHYIFAVITLFFDASSLPLMPLKPPIRHFDTIFARRARAVTMLREDDARASRRDGALCLWRAILLVFRARLLLFER